MRFAIKKKTVSIAVAAMVASLLVLVTMNTTARPSNVNQDVGVLRVAQSIPLPGVKGRIDHIATDIGGQRLFIAALGNDTLEIVDLRSGKRIHSITGLHEPQDVTYVPEINRIFVSNGASGSVSIFDSRSLRYEGNITFSGDADNLRYDAHSKYLYVGYGKGSLAVTECNVRDNCRRHQACWPSRGISAGKQRPENFCEYSLGKTGGRCRPL